MAQKKFISWHIRRSKDYHKLEWVNSGELLDAFIEFVSPRVNQVIVDLGTGTGKVAEAIDKSGALTVGIDYSMEMLAIASQNIKSHIIWIHGDSNFIPFPENAVDKVCARMLLHHLVNPSKAILECARILKPGGALFICEGIAPDAESFNNWVKMNQILEPGRKTFSCEILERLLLDAGFVNIQKKVIITPGLSTKNWLKDRGDSPKIIKKIMDLRRNLPGNEKKSWNLKEIKDDILVDVSWLMMGGYKPKAKKIKI